MFERKYEIKYSIDGIVSKNKIVVTANTQNRAIQQFKGHMELMGIRFTGYFVNEITYIK